jgi:hypothetical protein
VTRLSLLWWLQADFAHASDEVAPWPVLGPWEASRLVSTTGLTVENVRRRPPDHGWYSFGLRNLQQRPLLVLFSVYGAADSCVVREEAWSRSACSEGGKVAVFHAFGPGCELIGFAMPPGSVVNSRSLMLSYGPNEPWMLACELIHAPPTGPTCTVTAWEEVITGTAVRDLSTCAYGLLQ